MNSSTVLVPKGILSARVCPIPAKKPLNACAILVGSSVSTPLIFKVSIVVLLGWPLINDFMTPRFSLDSECI